MTGANTHVQGKRKTKVGRVVSDKMVKTIVVSVERLARHRLYKRVIRLSTKFKAHDEANEARIGDTVLIEESRPLSATKRWRLVSIVARAGDHGLPGEVVEGETVEAVLDGEVLGAARDAARGLLTSGNCTLDGHSASLHSVGAGCKSGPPLEEPQKGGGECTCGTQVTVVGAAAP